MRHSTLFTFVLVATLVALPALAQHADVSGSWTMTLETPQGASTPTLVLKQSGQTLTGTFEGRMGETPVTGTVKDTAISLSVKVNAQGQELELVFSGAADGDQMKGTVDFGGMGTANWSAARKK